MGSGLAGAPLGKQYLRVFLDHTLNRFDATGREGVSQVAFTGAKDTHLDHELFQTREPALNLLSAGWRTYQLVVMHRDREGSDAESSFSASRRSSANGTRQTQELRCFAISVALVARSRH